MHSSAILWYSPSGRLTISERWRIGNEKLEDHEGTTICRGYPSQPTGSEALGQGHTGTAPLKCVPERLHRDCGALSSNRWTGPRIVVKDCQLQLVKAARNRCTTRVWLLRC